MGSSIKPLPKHLQNAQPDPDGVCASCALRRRVGSAYPGKKVVEGGKCIRPEGHCEPYKEFYAEE